MYRKQTPKWQKLRSSLLVTTYYVHGLNATPKNRDWPNEFENLIKIYVAYKRLTLD